MTWSKTGDRLIFASTSVSSFSVAIEFEADPVNDPTSNLSSNTITTDIPSLPSDVLVERHGTTPTTPATYWFNFMILVMVTQIKKFKKK